MYMKLPLVQVKKKQIIFNTPPPQKKNMYRHSYPFGNPKLITHRPST